MGTNITFIEKMNKRLAPITNKIANQRHLRAVSSGIMATIPITIIGAFLMIVAKPPVNDVILSGSNFFTNILKMWVDFAQKYQDILIAPYNMTMGIFSLITAFTIAYNLAKSYKISALSSAITSCVIFLLVVAPGIPAIVSSAITNNVDIATLPITNMIDMSYLGSEGLFTSIIIACLSVEINRFCVKKNIGIKMPSSVPPTVSEPFSAVIPLVMNLIVIYGVNVILILKFNMALPKAIMTILTPSINAITNPFTIILLAIFTLILWVFGIHGSSIMAPIVMPIIIQATMINSNLVQNGDVPIFNPIFIWSSMAIGGTGCTLGLAILMSRSKSKQLSTIGKIGVIPGLCGINEPVIFGLPIMFNPIMSIPFIIAPIVSMILSWFGYYLGILTMPYIPVLTLLPIGISQFMGTLSIANA
ncbi:MAG: PTS sugar transporter subunit IIC, partial [Sarcina sp.]